jgi:hypothetical protein
VEEEEEEEESLYSINTIYGTSYSGEGYGKGKGKVHPCTGSEALYRPYDP